MKASVPEWSKGTGLGPVDIRSTRVQISALALLSFFTVFNYTISNFFKCV